MIWIVGLLVCGALIVLGRWIVGGLRGQSDPAIRTAANFEVAVLALLGEIRKAPAGRADRMFLAVSEWRRWEDAILTLPEPDRQRAKAILQARGRIPLGARDEIIRILKLVAPNPTLDAELAELAGQGMGAEKRN